MKNIYHIFIFLIMFYTTLNAVTLTQEEKEFIKSHPTITLGASDSWAPYIIKNKNGTITGYNSDILEKINKFTGANFTQVVGKLSDIKKRAKEKKIDGLSTVIRTDEREKWLNFSDTYISIKKMLMVKQGNPLNIRSKEDLAGKTIVIDKNNESDKIAVKKFKKSKIIYVSSAKKILEMVIFGKADATFGNGTTTYMLTYFGFPNMDYAFSLDDTLELKFAVRKDWPLAISILNKGLSSISKYEKLELKQKWFYNNKNINKINLTNKELMYLKNKKVIKMCVDPDRMPFEKIKNAKHIGIASDYMQIISHKLDIAIKFINTDNWQESMQKAKNRECDIYSIVSITPEKKRYMDFTKPYVKVPIVLATRAKELYVGDIADILDKKFVVLKGHSVESFLRKKYPNIKIITVNSIEDGLNIVKNSKAFAYIDNLATINYMIQKEFIGVINISGRVDADISYRVATRNDEAILKSIFQKALDSIDSNKKHEIFDKWVLLNNKNKIDYTLVWQIIVLFSLILFIVLYFLFKQNILKKEIENFNLNLQNRVQEAIKEIQDKNSNFRDILDATVEMIVFYDENKIVTEVNNTGVKMLKYKTKSDIIGKNIVEFIPKNQLEKVKKYMVKDIAEPYELELIKSDKSHLPVILSGRNVIRDNQKRRMLTIMDATGIKNHQRMIQHQSKLAQMGEMLSMIAHQWRQPLNAISVTSSNLQFKCMMDDIDKDFFEQELKLISKYSQHLSKTIDDFRGFLKDNKEKEMTSLTKIVDDTLDIVRISIKNKNIEIIKKIECDFKFETYQNELKQVVLNLIKNAEDVLLENSVKNGQITITIDKTVLIVQDNGGGVPDDVIDKVFEPYFSTKTKKDGTGLGLYMSKIIIEEHCGGKLSVSNDKDGAVFRIEL